MAQAFQGLIQPLLGKSELELSKWRADFLQALGSEGSLILNLVPELKLIIGEQPAVPDLPPTDAKARFQSVFRRFIGVFAKPEHPLALFLDDLQWLDAATVDVIENLLTQPDVHHLLLIGAYRSNEVGPEPSADAEACGNPRKRRASERHHPHASRLRGHRAASGGDPAVRPGGSEAARSADL